MPISLVASDGVVEGYPSLRLPAAHIDSLVDLVVTALYETGVPIDEVLNTPPANYWWPLPTKYADDYSGVCLTPSAPRAIVRYPHKVLEAGQAYVDLWKKQKKMPDAAAWRPIKTLFRGYSHPLTFSRTPSAEPWTVSVDIALALWRYASFKVGNLDNFCVRLRRAASYPLVGIRDNTCLFSGMHVSVEKLNHYLHGEQGRLSFNTIDLLDRIHSWTHTATDVLDNVAAVQRALTLLKMHDSLLVMHRLERAIHAYKAPTFADPRLAELMYTSENLETLRDTWMAHAGEGRTRLLAVYDSIVPGYIDHDEWWELFKIDINTKVFGDRLEAKLVNGLERFMVLFLKRQRAVKAKKRKL